MVIVQEDGFYRENAGRRWLIFHGEEEGDNSVLFYTPDLRIGGLFADGYKGSLCGGRQDMDVGVREKIRYKFYQR